MGLQGLGIDPGIADPKRSRPAMGDQVEHPRRIALRSPLPQTPADPLQRMTLMCTIQHRLLRLCHQGLDLRTVEVGDQQMVEHLSLNGFHGEAGELHDAADGQ